MAGLVAAGILSLPERRLHVDAFLKLPKAQASRSLTAAVLEDRDER